jgi:lysophospholipase L1-like esterase
LPLSKREGKAQTKSTMNDDGNAERYAAKAAPLKTASPLKGKTIFWLGSSVTIGLWSHEETMPDYLYQEDGLLFKKDAISGTTLRQLKADDASYLSRLLGGKILSPKQAIDAFVCQLSTNDAWDKGSWGEIAPDKDPAHFADDTTLGAIETIIVYVRESWHCPIYFYTGSFYEDLNGKTYGLLVRKLQEIARKWNVPIIDLYSDEAFNAALPAERSLLMHDSIHPFRAGYELWWTPYFERFLLGRLGKDGRLK